MIERTQKTAMMHGAKLRIIHVMDRVPFVKSDPTCAMIETVVSLHSELERDVAEQIASLQDRLGAWP